MVTVVNEANPEGLDRLVRRTEGLQPWRRVFHVVGGSFVAWLVYTLTPHAATTRWLFGGALAVTFLADVLRLTYEPLNRVFFRAFSALACPREVDRLSMTWFLSGVFLVLWVPDADVVVPALLVLALADPSASVVGQVWGQRRLGKGTVEGTAAFFIVAALVLTPFIGVPRALVVAAIVAGTEVLPSRLDDNFVVPVSAAACLWLLR